MGKYQIVKILHDEDTFLRRKKSRIKKSLAKICVTKLTLLIKE